MQVERIRFDDIFDAPARTGDFSFRSAGRTTYGVALPGGAIPQPGATLAVAFARTGDWSSVLGVRDLATGRITLRAPAWGVALDELLDAWLVGPALLALGLLTGGLVGAGIAAALVAGGAVFILVRAVRRNRQVAAALCAVDGNQPPASAHPA